KPIGSRKRPARCAGTAAAARIVSPLMAESGWTKARAAAAPATSARREVRNTWLILRGVANGLQDVRRLRQNRFLEVGAIRDRRVERADAGDRRVEVLEQLAGGARGDLRAEAAHQLILVRDDETVGAPHVRGNG